MARTVAEQTSYSNRDGRCFLCGSDQLVGKAYDRAFAYRDGTQSLYDERIPLDWPRGVEAKAYEGEIRSSRSNWTKWTCAS